MYVDREAKLLKNKNTFEGLITLMVYVLSVPIPP